MLKQCEVGKDATKEDPGLAWRRHEVQGAECPWQGRYHFILTVDCLQDLSLSLFF